ncbi:SigE family RNA polymerase sigma factor [Actinomadura rupiterrae]|uniref:SigE family RNA polymerase sigma factor n=1 Tax=Actinomadura rupiterrae TaxID=559627 RepID=UPI0020A53D61|nr:SigE family RNA polymerase sigma factor [Actinomadura rupiterrae]MCP2338231.1 RNA polymerase sigma-70 factor (sigma-E family) [Actinomadura rupiterrae]
MIQHLTAEGVALPVPEVPYDELFEAHFWGMVRLAQLLGADDPEDVAQDAFVRLHRRRRLLRDPNAALAYLRSSVCNASRSRLRHLRMARRRHAQLADAPTVSGTPETAAVDHEDVAELLRAVDALPHRQREVLVLRYWLELTERETADALGIAVGTVKAHASRAIAALGKQLKDSP